MSLSGNDCRGEMFFALDRWVPEVAVGQNVIFLLEATARKSFPLLFCWCCLLDSCPLSARRNVIEVPRQAGMPSRPVASRVAHGSSPGSDIFGSTIWLTRLPQALFSVSEKWAPYFWEP